MRGRTYEESGVSLAAADEVVERLRAAVESTGARGSAPLPGSTRSARASARGDDRRGRLETRAFAARGRLRDAGRDLAAHCIDDVITTGAEPLFLLDYVAAHRLELEQVAELVEGAAEVCREAGCALIGGETAELPGVYREEELDFAGTCVGIVEAEQLVDGSRARPATSSSGFRHPGCTRTGSRSCAGSSAKTIDAELLLAPHRLYLDEVRELRAKADVKALAHVTGGGILGNLDARAPGRRGPSSSTGARGNGRPCTMAGREGVEEEGARRVFNLGIGMCAVVPEAPAGCARHREAHVIGVLVSGEGTNLQALIDAGLPIVAVASNKAGVHALERAKRPASRPRPSSSTITPTARRATPRWPTGSASAASTWSSAPGTCTSSAAAFSSASPAA